MPYQWTVEVDVTGDLNDDRLDLLTEQGLGSAVFRGGGGTLWFDWSCGCPDCPSPASTADAISRVSAALSALDLEHGPIRVVTERGAHG